MASIFTYDPDPPRVASPWLQSSEGEGKDSSASTGHTSLHPATPPLRDGSSSKSRVLRLHAEPQEGPVEYKLHLLLRPRRKFRSTSTGGHISGSKHSKVSDGSHRSVSDSTFDAWSSSGTSTPASNLPPRPPFKQPHHILKKMKGAVPHGEHDYYPAENYA